MSSSIINGNYIFTYVPYVNVEIWILILLISIAFFILSYLSPRARLLFSGLSLLFGVAVMWGSMSLAKFNYAVHGTVTTVNETVANLTTSTEVVSYIPTIESLTSEWLTTLSRVYVVILFLSLIWIVIESYLPKERIATLSGGGVDVGSLNAVHDDKLYRVGGGRR
jgi:hypothetical protein